MWGILLKEAAAAIFTAIAGLGSKLCMHKAKKRFGEKTIFKEGDIRRKLIEARIKYGAARAWLARFHNGETFVDGDHREFYSIDDIEVDDGISRPIGEPHMYSNIPVQKAYELLRPLFEKNEIIMKSSDFTRGSYWYNMLNINQVETILVVLIRDDNQRYGFLGITWTTLKPLNAEIEFETAKDIATEICVMLKK